MIILQGAMPNSNRNEAVTPPILPNKPIRTPSPDCKYFCSIVLTIDTINVSTLVLSDLPSYYMKRLGLYGPALIGFGQQPRRKLWKSIDKTICSLSKTKMVFFIL